MCTPPIKRQPYSATNEMAFGTPKTPDNFSRELRQALQDRNLLTAKTRHKVCSMLERSPIVNPEMDKRKKFRCQAIQEIITSEQTYLSQLEMLMHYFVCPLKEQAIINGDNHTRLFGQIEMIYNLNGELLRELAENTENVAHAFLKMAPFFKLYSVYAFDYKSSLLILQSLTSKNPIFRKFLAETESRPEVQRKLNSLLIVPIQRVPRYKLLLEQVLLYTSPADPDYKLLKESVKQIESTVSHINSCIEDQEVTQMLINIQNSLVNRTPNIVKPSRKVIKEGVLLKVTRNGTELKRYCVLMSDIFMYCKIVKERAPNTVVENSLECCCIFPLKKSKVYELFPGNFKVTCQGDGILLGTSDLQVCRAWMGFIRDAIDLHVQCRKTLRKESSKRTPIRKKDIRKFDMDYILSPTKKKSDFETIFRNKNRSSDSEDEQPEDLSTTCFPRKRKMPMNSARNDLKKTQAFKHSAGSALQPPKAASTKLEFDRKQQQAEKTPGSCISNLYKYIASDRKTSGAPKDKYPNPSSAISGSVGSNSNMAEQDQSYGFASRYSDTKSYFRTHNVDTMPTTAQREHLFGGEELSDGGNIRDVLFPLRSSGGSGKSANSNANSGCSWSTPTACGQRQAQQDPADMYAPPQKKRVKFDHTQHAEEACVKDVAGMNYLEGQSSGGDKKQQQPYAFPKDFTSKVSLRDRIYNFFAELF